MIFLMLFFITCVQAFPITPPSPSPSTISVVLMLPTSQTEPTLIQGRDPITVVFSRSVIALGQDWGDQAITVQPFRLSIDIPGKMRWVTTSIGRFDPWIDWPNDLVFNAIVDQSVRSYDNITAIPFQQSFQTPPLSVYISDVESNLTKLYTDDYWQSDTLFRLSNGTWTSTYEVPPDGNINLYFSSAIDVSLVTNLIRIHSLNRANQYISFSTKNCIDDSSSQCLTVIPKSLLGVETLYVLTIPAGSLVQRYAGLTKQDNNVMFYGLFPFRFSFLDFSTDEKPSYYIYKLYLRHGLQNNTLPALKNAISFNPYVNFTVEQVDAATLFLRGKFEPSSRYSLSVRGTNSVTDKWLLPLLSSTTTFRTQSAKEYITQAHEEQAQFLHFSTNWTIFVHENLPYSTHLKNFFVLFPEHSCMSSNLSFVPVTSNNLVSAIRSNFYTDPSSIQNPRISVFNSDVSNSLSSSLNIPYSPLFSSGLVFLGEVIYDEDSSCYANQRTMLLSMNNVGVTFIINTNEQTITAWVLNMEDNTPVSGANVIYYFGLLNNQVTTKETRTDGQGFATLDISTLPIGDSTFWGVVRTPLQYLLPMNLYASLLIRTAPPPTYVAEIVIDRALYKPGDMVYLKGYVRVIPPNSNEPKLLPSGTDLTLSISWISGQPADSYSLQTSAEGTFSTSLTVPLNASYETNDLSLLLTSTQNTIATQSLVVANPRIPQTNIELTLNESVLRPGKSVNVKVVVATYTGQGIANAEVTLQWTIERDVQIVPAGYSAELSGVDSGVSEGVNQGSVNITTDGEGVATLDFYPPYGSNVRQGDRFTFTVEYVSPTKDVLQATATLPVSYSNYLLGLKLSASGDIPPCFLFGVFAVVSAYDNNLLHSLYNVSIKLYDRNSLEMPTFDQMGRIQLTNPVKECFFSLDTSLTNLACDVFKLPSVGHYFLVGTLIDPDSNYVSSTVLSVGKNLTEWNEIPYSQFNDIEVMLDKEKYLKEENATFLFVNPYGKLLVLALWGNKNQKIVSLQKQGICRISLPLLQNCTKGCQTMLIMQKPSSTTTSATMSINAFRPPDVPTSILFDPYGPSSFISTDSITVVRPVLNLEVKVKLDDVVLPGSSNHMDIELYQDGVPSKGEVTVFVVDKAVLDLKPLEVTKYNESLANAFQSWGIPYSSVDIRQYVASLEGYIKARQIIERRYRSNPYIEQTWDLFPWPWGRSELDMSDEELEKTQWNYAITPFPFRFLKFPFNLGGGIRMDSETALTSSPLSTGTAQNQQLTFRENFITTPVFIAKIAVGTTGRTQVYYTLPDNIGTYEVRVYAIQNNSFGAAVSSQISRKPISIEGSLPRIVRTGDSFKAGVFIIVHQPDYNGAIVVTIKTSDQLNVTSDRTVTVSVQGLSELSVSFDFVALKTGNAQLNFTAIGQGTTSNDAIALSIDVEGKTEEVFIATSMSLNASTLTQSTQEGLQLPEAESGGIVEIQVGVGRLPALIVFSEQIFQRIQNPYCTSLDLLATVSPYVVLRKYSNLMSNLTSQSDDSFRFALNKLISEYTDTTLGLQLYPLDPERPPIYTDVELQAFGIYMLGLLNNNITSQVSNTWLSAMDRQIVSDVLDARNYHYNYSSFDTLAFVFLAIPYWVPQGADAEALQILSFDNLVQHATVLSNQAKAALALTLLGSTGRSSRYNATLVFLFDTLLSAFRVQGRTAYISVGSDPDYIASALGLSAFVKAHNVISLIEKLTNFVAQEHYQMPFFQSAWLSSSQIAYSILAVGAYDEWKQNVNPQLDLTVTSNQTKLLERNFDSTTSPDFQTSYPFDQVGQTITFQATGRGEASIVLGLSFVPLYPNLLPVYRGISIEKIVQVIDPSSLQLGPPTTRALFGQFIKVTIQVTLPDNSDAVDIVDALPGGYEALDTSVFSTPLLPSVTGINQWFTIDPFSFTEFQQDKVIFHGQGVVSGSHEVSYTAVATTVGQFWLPGAYAFDVKQPELMGMSSAGTFSVGSM